MRRGWRRRLRPWRRTTVATLVTALVSVPFWWLLTIAIKPDTDVFSFPPSWWPSNPTFDNFRYVWETTNLPSAMANSMIVGGLTVAGNVIGATAAGYAFARLRFAGSRLVFTAILGAAMVPAVVQLIPLYLVTQHFPLAGGNNLLGEGGTGLLNTHAGLVLPLLVQPLNIYLARQYFLGLPEEMAEAARIDGATETRIFRSIYLPLARPIVATIAVLAFTGAWEDFLWPLVLVSSPDMRTLPLELSQYAASGVIQYGPLMAATVIATTPVILVFLAGQRHFVRGLAAGGVKG